VLSSCRCVSLKATWYESCHLCSQGTPRSPHKRGAESSSQSLLLGLTARRTVMLRIYVIAYGRNSVSP
jgi:hypothetical protein